MFSTMIPSHILAGFSILSHVFAWDTPKEYPLQVSKDGRHFLAGAGDPFFWQADTAWVVFHRLNLTEAETYLEDRASKGFNIILAVAVNQFG
jgi:hypothetical protein